MRPSPRYAALGSSRLRILLPKRTDIEAVEVVRVTHFGQRWRGMPDHDDGRAS
jgi:hypothetical protein